MLKDLRKNIYTHTCVVHVHKYVEINNFPQKSTRECTQTSYGNLLKFV
jgi:hypothetical protein